MLLTRSFLALLLAPLAVFAAPPGQFRKPGQAVKDDSMAHFIPTKFDRGQAFIVGAAAQGAEKPVLCSEPLVESNFIQAKSGTLIPLVNWSGGPVKKLKVTLMIDVPFKTAALASGKPVEMVKEGGKAAFTLDLDVADALILRP